MKLPPADDLETWQDLVDGAYACLALDAAKKYGLVTGGPTINVKQCEKVIELGRERGITTRRGAVVEKFIEGFEALRREGRAPASSRSTNASPPGRQSKASSSKTPGRPSK